jgi:hypothetical protein
MTKGIWMANANLLAILVAAATGFLIGGLWYGPLFGKAWMAEHGFTEEQMRGGNMLKIYALPLPFRCYRPFSLAIY